jgi:LysR family transcriptional regulator of gallate degradation
MESLRKLRTFVATCDSGSAAQAARLVHLSQPAVSAALVALERAAQAALFRRGPRGMAPTEAGLQLLGRVRAGLGHLDAAALQLRYRRASGSRWPWLATAVQLRALCALAETRGLSSAARVVGVAQPSLHRALRSFESLAAVSFWRRVGSGIELSSEATVIARAANLFGSELRMGFEEIRELRGQLDGTLRVGALPMPRSNWLPRSLALLLQDYPGASAEVMDGPYENQLAALRNGQIDVLLGALRFPAPGPDVMQEALFDDRLSVVVRAGHPLAARRGDLPADLTATQLRSLGWLLPPRATPARQTFERFMARQGAGPARCAVECNSLIAIRSLLLQSDYAALISVQQIEFEIALGQLRPLGPPIAGTVHPIGLALRRGFQPTSLLRAFLDHVRRHAERLSGAGL